VREQEATGKISLIQFYLRRAKRLLPASWLMMLAVVIVAFFLTNDALVRLRSDVLASLGYVTNWEFIYNGQSYFESMGRQPLLLHLWSLAIEEQFYLLWAPLVFFILPRFGRRTLAALGLLLAVSSCLFMLWQASAMGYPDEGDPTRLYFGTDTHGFGLLLGACLGLLFRKKAQALSNLSNIASSAVGVLSLAALIWMMTSVGEETAWLYPWGFALCALLSLALIQSSASGSFFGHLLDKEPMRWVGERSYGIYLWHWPIFMMTRPELDMQLDDVSIFILRITVTLVVAAISYRFIEMPIRRGILSRISGRTYALAALPSAGALVALVSIMLTAQSEATPEPAPIIVAAVQAPASPPKEPRVSPAEAKERKEFQGRELTAIGDSVLLGAKPVLEKEIPGAKVIAKVSKQAAAVLKEVQGLHDAHALTPYVVVHLGTNGYVTEKQLRSILSLLNEQKRVVLMNTKVPRQWAKPNNQLMGQIASEYPNVVLADWNHIADHHPEFFVADGVHLTARGQQAFVNGIKSKLIQN